MALVWRYYGVNMALIWREYGGKSPTVAPICSVVEPHSFHPMSWRSAATWGVGVGVNSANTVRWGWVNSAVPRWHRRIPCAMPIERLGLGLTVRRPCGWVCERKQNTEWKAVSFVRGADREKTAVPQCRPPVQRPGARDQAESTPLRHRRTRRRRS